MKYQDPLGLSEEQRKYVDDGTGKGVGTNKAEIKGNSGKAIQSISIIIMLVGVVSTLLLAIMVGTIISNVTDMEEAGGLLCGMVVFAIGCLFSWAGSLIMRGFGELVEHMSETAAYLEFLCRISHKEL